MAFEGNNKTPKSSHLGDGDKSEISENCDSKNKDSVSDQSIEMADLE